MEKRHLHLKGPALSQIVAGAWRWNSVDVAKLIRTSLDAGITSFDHAISMAITTTKNFSVMH